MYTHMCVYIYIYICTDRLCDTSTCDCSVHMIISAVAAPPGSSHMR